MALTFMSYKSCMIRELSASSTLSAEAPAFTPKSSSTTEEEEELLLQDHSTAVSPPIGNFFSCFACGEVFNLSSKPPVQCTSCWFSICAPCASKALYEEKRCPNCQKSTKTSKGLSFVPNQSLMIFLKKESVKRNELEGKIRRKMAPVARHIAGVLSTIASPPSAAGAVTTTFRKKTTDTRYTHAISDFEKIATASSEVFPFDDLSEVHRVGLFDCEDEDQIEYLLWNKLIWPKQNASTEKGDWRIVRARDACNEFEESRILPNSCQRHNIASAPDTRTIWGGSTNPNQKETEKKRIRINWSPAPDDDPEGEERNWTLSKEFIKGRNQKKRQEEAIIEWEEELSEADRNLSVFFRKMDAKYEQQKKDQQAAAAALKPAGSVVMRKKVTASNPWDDNNCWSRSDW